MNTLLKPLIAATLLSLTLGSVAMAKPEQGTKHHCMKKQGHHRAHARGMDGSHQPRFLKGIDLTNAQKDKIFALTHAEMPKKREHMKARRVLRKELMAVSNNYSEAQASTIANNLGNLTRDTVLARARHHQKVLNVLTAAQKQQVAENKAKFKAHHKRGFHGVKGEQSKRFHQGSRQSVAI